MQLQHDACKRCLTCIDDAIVIGICPYFITYTVYFDEAKVDGLIAQCICSSCCIVWFAGRLVTTKIYGITYYTIGKSTRAFVPMIGTVRIAYNIRYFVWPCTCIETPPPVLLTWFANGPPGAKLLAAISTMYLPAIKLSNKYLPFASVKTESIENTYATSSGGINIMKNYFYPAMVVSVACLMPSLFASAKI